MTRDFRTLLENQWNQGKFLCVGLDTDLEKVPESARNRDTKATIVAFNRAIIDATKDIASAYKPNTAFYEAHGDQGWNALRETINYILEHSPDTPIILDAKRADIGSTNEAYAAAAFDHLRADAVTVAPYQGGEALAPFFERKNKGILVWCKSSNTGSGEFQNMEINGDALYKVVARHVADDWNKNGNCGLVVGATYPEELAEVRQIVGDLPLLIPGIGAQGGDLEKTIRAGRDSRGQGMIIGASRSIMYASAKPDFADAAREKSQELDSAIRAAL